MATKKRAGAKWAGRKPAPRGATTKPNSVDDKVRKAAGCTAEQVAAVRERMGVNGLDFSECTEREFAEAAKQAYAELRAEAEEAEAMGKAEENERQEASDQPNGPDGVGGAARGSEPQGDLPMDEPENDMGGFPREGQPYTLRVADPVAQHGLADLALKWSRAIGFRVAVVDRAGKVARIIDGRIGGPRKRAAAPRERAAPSDGPRTVSVRVDTSPETNKALIEALLARELNSREVREITGWPNPKMSMRHAVAAVADAAGYRCQIAGKGVLRFRFTK